MSDVFDTTLFYAYSMCTFMYFSCNEKKRRTL